MLVVVFSVTVTIAAKADGGRHVGNGHDGVIIGERTVLIGHADSHDERAVPANARKRGRLAGRVVELAVVIKVPRVGERRALRVRRARGRKRYIGPFGSGVWPSGIAVGTKSASAVSEVR